jgi:SAM-dependent methyltransferase
VRGIVSDVAHVDELADASVDAVVSSQVIEHLPDDRVLAPEIARLLKPGGWFYVSSVIRGPHAFWLYKGKPPAPERWQLDPTHMREYESEQQFRSVLEQPELRVRRRALVAAEGAADGSRLPRRRARAPAPARAAARALPRATRLGHEGAPRDRRADPGYRWVEATGRRR